MRRLLPPPARAGAAGQMNRPDSVPKWWNLVDTIEGVVGNTRAGSNPAFGTIFSDKLPLVILCNTLPPHLQLTPSCAIRTPFRFDPSLNKDHICNSSSSLRNFFTDFS